MIDHLIITVRDFEASKAFYQKALKAIGHRVSQEYPWKKARLVGFGGKDLEFFIVEGKATRPLMHFAFRVTSRRKVRAFYKAAIAAGGRDNGKPELSPQYHAHYYSAYVFDPEGHNVEVVCHEKE